MTVVPAPELLAVPMSTAAAAHEIYSGIARLAGTLWCTRHRARADTMSQTVVLVVHPSSNFMGHYALRPLAAAGVDAVGMSTRYIGNDSALLLENCVLDVGAVIRRLRDEGYERIVLLGNSGGGALASLYQSQAESPTITDTPAGGGPDLTTADLSPADLLVVAMAHPGRAQLLTDMLDPSLRSEDDPFDRDPELDMFRPENGPPYDADWLQRYRAAQAARNERITDWAESRLSMLAEQHVADLPFLVHAVCAEPRNLDLSLDPSDRAVGTLWGDPWSANLQPSTLGHYTTVRSWLSQWSVRRSNGYAPAHLARISAPVHVYYGSADTSCFPSDALSMFDAVGHDDKRLTTIEGGHHYLTGQPELVARLVDSLTGWIDEH